MLFRNFFSGLIVAILVLLSIQGKASHTTSIELTYRHIINQTYEFTLVFYRNCNGSSSTAPISMPLTAISNSLNINTSMAVNLVRLPITGPGIPKLHPQEIYNCIDTVLCYEEYVYRGTLNLYTLAASPFANDWVFNYSLCCFPFTTNVDINTSISTSCQLNNLDFPNGNNSPFWHNRRPNHPGHLNDTIINYPIKTICANRDIFIPLNVTDYDSDSVIYELTEINNNQPSLPVNYNAPYSFLNPMPLNSPPGLSIDNSTGILRLSAAPDPSTVVDPDRYALSLEVTEFRKDSMGVMRKLGYIERVFQIIVESPAKCPDDSIRFSTNPINLRCDTIIPVELVNSFNCMSMDTDGSFFTLLDSATGIPVFVDTVTTTCYNNSSNQFDIHLSAPLVPGTYFLILKNGKDFNSLISECGSIFSAINDTLKILVNQQPGRILGSLDSLGKELPFIRVQECGINTLKLNFSDRIQCSSLSFDGTDLLLTNLTGTDTIGIDSLKPLNCNSGTTREAYVFLNKGLAGNRYYLRLKVGSDGNNILDDCSNTILNTPKTIRVDQPEIDLGPNRDYCKDEVYSFTVDAGPGAAYLWNTGDTTRYLTITSKDTYYVESDNGRGCLASDTLYVTENKCVGISELSGADVSIYPIPTSNKLFIDIPSREGLMRISITDLSGREVLQLSADVNPKQIEVSALEAGVYLTHISVNGNLVTTAKIIIQ